MSDLVQQRNPSTVAGQPGSGGGSASTGPDQIPSVSGYEILGKLGAGAMGEVFHARHLESGKEVALKLMVPALNERKDLVQRFDREIKLLSQLKHPNIAGAVGQGTSEGRLYMAMEFVKGPNLANLLKVVGVFNEADVLRVGLQVATALGYAWTKVGLVHRDIKPANLLVIPDPSNQGGETIKIIDFGLARSTYNDDMGMTMTGMVMGTPNYMSPEQVRGEKDLKPQCDMYALGCTLYHLLTGRLPFEANAPGQVLAAHLNDPVPDPSRLVPSIASSTRHLVMTLMAKDVGKRFTDYQALIASCEAALRTLSMRDTSSIKLLRRPMVLSKPRMKQVSNTDAATLTSDPFQHETARLRRREKASGEAGAAPGSEYKPSTDKHPNPAAEQLFPETTSRRARPGSATEALAKAATEKVKRQHTTSVHRKNTGRTGKNTSRIPTGNTTNPTVESAQLLPIPALPARDRGSMPEAHHETHERHWVAWAMVVLAVIGLILAAVFRPGG
jgi:serine/threonine protein kinase